MSSPHKLQITETSRLKQKVHDAFVDIFHSEPKLTVFAPGRVNLIGEHTDYSDGFVFPLAINLGIIIALFPSKNNHVKLYSLDFDQYLDQKISSFSKGSGEWKDYVKGVGWQLRGAGFEVNGFSGVVAGNLPIGAGLSSSAALEVAAAKSFCLASNIALSNTELAKITQKAEEEWVGVNVGIMDQLISAVGKSGHAVKIDCRTLDTHYVPVPEEVNFIVLDTMTRRELSRSDYNTRHEEVNIASRILGVSHLRDASLALLNEKRAHLSEIIYNRAKHVVTENERVHAFTKEMETGDLFSMGKLINESHRSLRDDFEVSSEALNRIVEIAQKQRGCYGARMTGAGFGGCALAVIDEVVLESFIDNVHQLYKSEMGINPKIYKVKSTNGVHLLD